MSDMGERTFKRSSYCDGGGCVEVYTWPSGNRTVRDSKTGAELILTAAEWETFVYGVQNGDFEG